MHGQNPADLQFDGAALFDRRDGRKGQKEERPRGSEGSQEEERSPDQEEVVVSMVCVE